MGPEISFGFLFPQGVKESIMDASNIRSAFDERNRVIGEVRELHVAAEGRELDAEEVAVEARLEGAIADLDVAIDGGLALIERSAKADAAREKLEAVEARAAVVNVSSEARTAEKAAIAGLANGSVASYEARDLTAGTATDGAELVPTTLYGQIIEHMIEQSPIMQLATVLRTAGGEALDIPKTTAYSAASLVAEAGAIGESDPQFSTVSLGAFKYAFIVQSSAELLQDAAFNVEAFIAKQGGAALGRGVDTALVTGDGSSKPNGVDKVATGVTAASATAVTTDELIDLQHSVLSPYRNNAAWLMNDSTLAEIRKFKDSNGLYLWQPSVQAGVASSLLGKPVYTDPNMGASDTGINSILFGDFSGYYVRLAGGVRIERSSELGFANDLVSWRFIVRADGDIVDTVGIRALTQA